MTPLFHIAYERWREMPYREVLNEMALLFHLAVQIEVIEALRRAKETDK